MKAQKEPLTIPKDTFTLYNTSDMTNREYLNFYFFQFSKQFWTMFRVTIVNKDGKRLIVNI